MSPMVPLGQESPPTGAQTIPDVPARAPLSEREATERVDELVEAAVEATEPGSFNRALAELDALIQVHPGVLPRLHERREELLTRLEGAKIGLAGISAKLAISTLATAKPVPSAELHRTDLARGGPATEIALAAFHILRYAGEIVAIRSEDIEAALEAPEAEPDFASYPALFAAAVAHIRTASYYLLDPAEAFAALASESPQQESFPPLPFPRIWIEMRHLAPYMRFRDESADRDSRWATIDVLGIGIAEIEPGRVWDVIVPFDFGQSEFFVVGVRIAPDGVIDADPALVEIEETFAPIRALAIGGAHLITARNVPTERVVLPRAQRRRMTPEEQEHAGRVYFVNLAAAGEGEHATYGGPREYHVRWLVRGHWRHTDSGRSFCTCCDPPQIATWIQPYVKGPIGAPWKGKQVRR